MPFTGPKGFQALKTKVVVVLSKVIKFEENKIQHMQDRKGKSSMYIIVVGRTG